ncbi:hypothetical protein M422DRAFT_46997 [Sphaerobolus stellatus SS14]|uniref:Protein BNI4 n=1 Tax=Sphaerobolus stellatus (strain SS14) TaxID=990650 RepID=A0A0C9VDR4_SPHS4|nr:hypothetical protein M422DRAFT_46997 [Sphaerobolus stellatus SS14]
MFNAQAQAQFHAQQHQQVLPQPEFPRTRSATPPQQQQQQTHPSTDYYQQGPRADNFHSYSSQTHRPRQISSSSSAAPPPAPAAPPQPPYVRADASGSSSSVNSGSSGGSRSRKGSNPSPSTHSHGRTGSSSTTRSSSSASTPSPKPSLSPVISTTTSVARPNKPSPLGQAPSFSAVTVNGTTSASRPSSSGTVRPPSPPATPRAAEHTPAPPSKPTHNKRLSISKDDSQLGDPTPVSDASTVRSSGLKGRLRRALSFNATSTLNDIGEGEDGKLNSRRKALANASKVNAAATAATAASSSSQASDTSPPGSPTTPTGPTPPPADKGKSRVKRSLFNSKINASTDNISLSSTVSSASVMIRKLGSMGRLARKNSLMTITGLFGKDKDKRGTAAEASVSLATAEVDRTGESDGALNGLTPAARLARQHTLKSNEEAARRKAAAEEEAARKERERAQREEADALEWERVSRTNVAPVWDRGTKNKRGEPLGNGVINEEEEEGNASDDSDETYDPHRWGDEDQDATVRLGQVGSSSQQKTADEEWGEGIPRGVERTRRPKKGILKNANTYDQEAILHSQSSAPNTRVRSNSYNQNNHNTEPGPLARIPSPDPDHIDGLHQHKEYVPPFTFEDVNPHRPSSPQPEKGFFNLANGNSSAPALSTITSSSQPPLAHRSATAPVKRLSFAANLSIYDTFSATVYDRRSEPATCNRLTPALAQRIKEELNSYKMEEMEVHAASRVHTQFFV